MWDMVTRLQRIAERRARREFDRWSSVWNPPYPLWGAAVAFGLMGAAVCYAWAVVIVIFLARDYWRDPMFWFLVQVVAFIFGIQPGFVLGASFGMAKALVWTKRSRRAGIVALLGAVFVIVHWLPFATPAARYLPALQLDWETMLVLGLPMLWATVLIVWSLNLLRKK